ncbi:11S globulin seed storage protein Ana o 2.0101-like [Cryptomeria japonica]|uniref:11S globulin seed storage protein Ana o 2.0101-like n=1 Tax=Cryptomeria japonica TaxID=3369 RepID=UPI0027DA04BC|nr:11S globulin seed storage protein Ana o 2.0101-like [Cryptomeria japonica]
MERNMRASLIMAMLLLCTWSCSEMVNGQQQQQQRRRQQQQQSCRGHHLRAQQPYERIRSEAGTIELSTRQDNDELDCAGVEIIRETIERDGLSVPRFQNTPELVYIVEGEGRLGVVFPGCPETFRRPPFGAGQGECQRRRRGSGQEEGEEEEERGSEKERSRREQECARDESSQKVRRVRRGDVVAIFAGAAYWWFNDGDKPLRIVAIADSSNYQNQLDKTYRPFFLAGSSATRERRERLGEGRNYGGNMLAGFDTNMLAEAFGVRKTTVMNLQENNEGRGPIIRVTEQHRRRPGQNVSLNEEDTEDDLPSTKNGLVQLFCNMRLLHNADRPEDADVFVRDGGRLNTINRFKLRALTHLNLAAERGVLRPRAMFAPSWLSCHAILYATRGDARIQVADNRGERVFDARVQEGQFLVIPQFYAVVKRAGDQGFEWIAFTTSHSPIRSSFTGRNSVLKGMPQEVVMHAYNISRREAHELRWNREHEFLILPPRRQEYERGRSNQ